jgi:hypothetical protein
MGLERGAQKRLIAVVWMAAVCISLALYAVALWFGALNQDEGWYLYAGRLVSEGQIPFVDFASTQGPLMAFVYAAAQPLVQLWGVAGGRLFTALFGIATLLCGTYLAYRLAYDRSAAKTDERRRIGLVAALLVFGLLGLSLYHIYFTTLVKTYALAGLLVTGGFLALKKALDYSGATKNGAVPAFVLAFTASGLFALAAGVRLSAGILLPVVWLMLAWYWLRRRSVGISVVGGFLAGGSVVLPAIYLPLIIKVPEALKFGLLQYHSQREVGSAAVMLAYKGGFILRLAGAYFPLLCCIAWALWAALRKRESKDSDTRDETVEIMLPLMLAGFTAVTLVHLAAKFPYDDYQVFIMPLPAIVAAVILAPLLVRTWIGLVFVLVLIPAHSISSTQLQEWLLAKRDRIWWPLRSETALQRLHRTAEVVKVAGNYGDEGGTLLTQDTYLAVEAGLRVPPGMELGPFCYFPDISAEEATGYHVLNRALLTRILDSGQYPVAAFSGYGLAIRCPQVDEIPQDEQNKLWKTLETSYTSVTNISDFGQADTTLRILKCREK